MNDDVPAIRLIPFGGLGEVGRNLLALECGRDIVVIDSGLMFPNQDMLGVDLVIPNVSWLVERQSRVRAIVLTHGHEDHIGALPFILPRLNVPVYGTALTLGLLRNKLREHKLLEATDLHTVVPGQTKHFGSLAVEWIHMTHSIPDACGLAIQTPLGTIVHTGDFKLDHTPVGGAPPDLDRLARLGDKGVLALLSDSTNAEYAGVTASERSVGSGLSEWFATASERILVATFASNVSRVQQAIDAAEECGRSVFLVGRSMMNISKVARDLGYLKVRDQTLLSPKQAERVKDKELLVVCTGAQGEPFSALSRIAAGEHPLVQLHEGDTVILSANPIPGNEEAVHRVVNSLFKRGARVIQGSRQHVHASGHASQEELKLVLALTRPRFFIPVHGEYRHLTLHADLGVAAGVERENIATIENGTSVELTEEGLHVHHRAADAGFVYVDGLSASESNDVILRDRQALAQDGVVVVLLTVERSTGRVVAGPDLISRGFSVDSETELLFDAAKDHTLEAAKQLAPDSEPGVWQSEIHERLSRFLLKRTKRRPLILPVVTEI